MGSRGASLHHALHRLELHDARRKQMQFSFDAEVDTIPGEDFFIGKSLGAKALNYDIKDPATGKIYHFEEGTTITNVEVFAGKGVRKKLHPKVVSGLCRHYGGRPKNWQHSKGVATIDYRGKPRTAEVHWFEEPAVGKVQFKVKEWLS